MSDLPMELSGVADALACEKGVWRTCSGCHESNEGEPTGPYSKILKCHLGGGCFECGGIGAIWDTTDYADMGRFLAEEAPYDDRKLLDALQHESWDLRCFNIPTGGDDCDIGWSVIGHWQAEPHERVVAEIYHDDPRAALRAAIVANEAAPSAQTAGWKYEEIDWKFIKALCQAFSTRVGEGSYDQFMVPVQQRWLTGMKAALVDATAQVSSLVSPPPQPMGRPCSALVDVPAVEQEPVAWRYRHDPTVSWSYSDTRHPRLDLQQEPLFAAANGWVSVPRKMTAAMINAWSGGLTVTTDEIAFHTSFQDAWARVLSAATTPAATGGQDNG